MMHKGMVNPNQVFNRAHDLKVQLFDKLDINKPAWPQISVIIAYKKFGNFLKRRDSGAKADTGEMLSNLLQALQRKRKIHTPLIICQCVNFIYNAAIHNATHKLSGIKVWDKCLAQACKNSPLRKFVGTRKNAGDLGDAVEAFIAFVYLKKPSAITEMISTLTKSITINKHLIELEERELCAKIFTDLVEDLCEDLGMTE